MRDLNTWTYKRSDLILNSYCIITGA